VLLVKPNYKPGWDLPGGYVEPGESPKQAAVREIAEELGVRPVIGRLLAVDWAPHPDEGDKLLFVFAGGEIDLSAIVRGEDELRQVAFIDRADLTDHLPDRLLTRVTSALTDDLDPYLERGRRDE
jgi:8-oxo-dGTP diphosphatase